MSTYQRKNDGTYAYAPATPSSVNVFSTSNPTVFPTLSPTVAPTSSPTTSPMSSSTATPTSGPTSSSIVEVVVNEVADKGSFGVCGGVSGVAGTDWVELFNAGTSTVDLGGWKLHDNNGVSSAETLTFPAGSTIPAGAFLLLCQSSNTSLANSFRFGISGTDTVTLVDASGSAVSTTGTLLNQGSTVSTYQRKNDGTYAYAPATPSSVNVFSTSNPTVFPTLSPASALTLSPVISPKTVVVNEVGDKGTYNVCGGTATAGGGDYVELLNTGTTSVNLTGWKLHDNRGATNAEALIFSSTSISAGAIVLLCNGNGGNFVFGIGGDDAVTLVDSTGTIVSTSGILQGLGSSDLSYQRKGDGTFVYAKPSPGSVNTFTLPNIYINEVAFDGSANACSGNDWVELYNDGSSIVDLGNYILHDNKSRSAVDTYTIPIGTTISAKSYLVLCKNQTFLFEISNTDSVTLVSPSGVDVSSSGMIANNASIGKTVVWARLPGGTSVYATSKDATPGAMNVFPFEPITMPWRSCGVANYSYGTASAYSLSQSFTSGLNPEFSGGTFDGRTCKHLVVGDEGSVTEFSFDGIPLAVNKFRNIQLIGGSRDIEGNCMYLDPSTGDTKYVFVDERERSVAMCDFPAESQGTIIYRESSNCVVFGLTQVQKNSQSSSEPNEGFEDVGTLFFFYTIFNYCHNLWSLFLPVPSLLSHQHAVLKLANYMLFRRKIQ